MLQRISKFAFCAALVFTSAFTTNLLAAGAQTFTIPIVNVTFNPTQCSSLTPTAVTLNGQYHITVHTTRNPDVTFTTKFQSEAHGTAVDNDGAPYVFNYNN